jgi:NAD(P)-dependent dehydrogenase (short-subunit alcohol dehydrogenase family)
VTATRELFDLSGRVAIVTGGGTGIGHQMAEGLAEMGADVVLCARQAQRCAEAARQLSQATGVRAIGLACDVRDPAAIQAVVDRAVTDFGRVDILVNNAGTTWAAAPEDVPLEGWQKVLDINLTGVFLFAQAAGRVMLAQGHGKIINIASIMATRGAPTDYVDAIAYNTSKGGVVTFTKDLACKWGPRGIHVNGIAPGWFPSIMSDKLIDARGDELRARIPLGRFGSEHDLKGAVVFLASAASDFVAGHVLTVDGGQIAQ